MTLPSYWWRVRYVTVFKSTNYWPSRTSTTMSLQLLLLSAKREMSLQAIALSKMSKYMSSRQSVWLIISCTFGINVYIWFIMSLGRMVYTTSSKLIANCLRWLTSLMGQNLIPHRYSYPFIMVCIYLLEISPIIIPLLCGSISWNQVSIGSIIKHVLFWQVRLYFIYFKW